MRNNKRWFVALLSSFLSSKKNEKHFKIEAKNNLAGLYFEEENYEKAKSLYTDAMENGCRESFENLGDLYYKLDEK